MVRASEPATGAPDAAEIRAHSSPKSQVERPAGPAAVTEGLHALNDEIVAALEAMRRLPITADDTRAVRAYQELMTALVWTKDLLIEAKAASRGGSSEESHLSKGGVETQP